MFLPQSPSIAQDREDHTWTNLVAELGKNKKIWVQNMKLSIIEHFKKYGLMCKGGRVGRVLLMGGNSL